MQPSPSLRRDAPTARSLALALAAALVLSLGCATGGVSDSDQPPADINAVFLDEALDVDQFVERFEGESRAVYAERFAIVNALGLTPGAVVADIGAGTGFFSFLLADAVGRTGGVYAVEISPRFLDHLRQETDDRGLDHVEVVEGTTTSVSLPEASTDLAFVCDVYHHFETPEASLASLYRAIKPGGELVVIDFHRIPGESPAWLLKHVRAGREVFQAEIEAAGFTFIEDIVLPGLDDNYILRFARR